MACCFFAKHHSAKWVDYRKSHYTVHINWSLAQPLPHCRQIIGSAPDLHPLQQIAYQRPHARDAQRGALLGREAHCDRYQPRFGGLGGSAYFLGHLFSRFDVPDMRRVNFVHLLFSATCRLRTYCANQAQVAQSLPNAAVD